MSFEQDAIVYRAVQHLISPVEGYIRIATNDDAETLFLFINKVYFEDLSKYKRKDFVNRLNRVEEIHNLMKEGIFLLLLTGSAHDQGIVLNDNYSVIACVFIHHLSVGELTKQTTKINLLAVHPAMMKRGIAGYMMKVVDAVAKEFHYTHLLVTVLSVKKHLLDIYTKWGFKIVEIKTLAEFGVDPEDFTVPCHFIVMEKALL